MSRAIGILGTGTMGAGIIQVAAQAGYTVVACDPAVEALEKARLYVGDGLGRSMRKGLLSEDEGRLRRPEKVCGTHFFTPPPVREAVEVPRGLLTSDETVEKVKELIESFGKLPVVVEKDVPGFVANRFLIPFLIEGARLLEEGVATKEETDLIVKRGLGFPIGPFEFGDFIGLDVALDVTSYVYRETGEPYYAPPRILKDLVRAGKLGRKTGEGSYEH